MGPKSHCSLLAYINIRKELLPICLRDKAKIALFFLKMIDFYFDLGPPETTLGQDRGAKPDPRGNEDVRIPGGHPGGGWSGLELTHT